MAVQNRKLSDEQQLFRIACQQGNTAEMRALLDQGVDPFYTFYDNTALHDAVYSHGPQAPLFLLREGLDVNARGEYGCTPLQLAVIQQFPSVIQVLLDHGADPNICSDAGNSSVYHASNRTRHLPMLLEAGADITLGARPNHGALYNLRKKPENDPMRQMAEQYAALPRLDLSRPLTAEDLRGEAEGYAPAICNNPLTWRHWKEVVAQCETQQMPSALPSKEALLATAPGQERPPLYHAIKARSLEAAVAGLHARGEALTLDDLQVQPDLLKLADYHRQLGALYSLKNLRLMHFDDALDMLRNAPESVQEQVNLRPLRLSLERTEHRHAAGRA